MLRVSKAEEWLRRAPTRPDLNTRGDCVLIRSTLSYDGKRGVPLASGVSGRTAGAPALCLHLIMIPPGSRGLPHFHAGHESAIYTVSGQNEVWHGAGLANRTVVRAGDFMYIPPGIPHLPVNRGDVTVIAIVARTGAGQPGSVVVVDLPGHLADLAGMPVAARD